MKTTGSIIEDEAAASHHDDARYGDTLQRALLAVPSEYD